MGLSHAGHPSQRNQSMKTKPVITRAKQRAFTLVEVLVVIAIILVLMALLFPALSRFKNSGDEVKFISNLRQVSVGLLSLANDNDATIPPFVDANLGAQTMWHYRVAPYVGEETAIYDGTAAAVFKSVLRDPGDKTLSPAYSPPSPTRNMAFNGWVVETTPPFGASNRKLASIKWPSRLALLGPGASAAVSTEWGLGARWNSFGIKQLGLQAFSRYGKFWNVAFVDGHIEKVSWERLNAEIALDEQAKSVFFDWQGNNGGEQ